jgi:hypothetical protein
MNSKSLQESVIERGLVLAESSQWRDHTVALREGYKARHGQSAPEHIVSTTAILLENTNEYMQRMDETTRVVNMGNFVDYGFDVITAVVPNLIAQDLVSVQPLNAKHGAIFYLNYLYGSNKGVVKQGDVYNNPFDGVGNNFNYTGELIDGESIGLGDGTKTAFSTTLGYTPVRPGSIVVTAAGVVATDNGQGELTGTGVSGTIDYATGAIAVTFSAAPAADVVPTAVYNYNMDLSDVGVPQVDLDLKSVSIEAFPRKIRARWLLDAAFELQKTKGIDAESELVVALSSEIKHEIDGEMLNDIYKLAALTGFTWDAKNPGGGIAYSDWKKTFIDLLTEMSNAVFKATKRIGANFIVAGLNVCNIIESLGAENFTPATLGQGQINGPHFIGTLQNKYRVYKNPFYGDNNFLMGYKGSSYLDAGYVYAPYMPLYATPTTVLDDFVFRKGLATSYGKLMLNNKLYAKGSITNFNAARFGV